MRMIVGIIFATVLMILAVYMYGVYMWGKGYKEGFEQAEGYFINNHRRDLFEGEDGIQDTDNEK